MKTVKSVSIEKVVKISIAVLMMMVTVLTVFGAASYFYFTHDLPSTETLRSYKPSGVTKIFAEDREIIGEFFYEKREVAPLDRIPNYLIQAFVAGEDARFFHHKGLDYVAILRALFRNIFSGEIVQGGSTITQQVVKSLLLSPEKSFARKIREAILAYQIEKYLTKEEILFLYLNQIYLGHGAYGVAAAAESYFGKTVEELNLAESAVLAGLPQAPSKNSPFLHPELAKKRQIYILNRMAEEGFVTLSEAIQASKTPYVIRSKEKPSVENAPYFVEYVRRYVEEKYGKDALYRNGLQVFSTIDLHFQKTAQEAVEAGLKEIEKREKYPPTDMLLVPEGALVCFDLETGYVKAMVGGRDFKKSQFNRVIQARRQTGSAFKPIVYASALDKGFTPSSIIVDSPIVFEWGDKKWKPKNFEGRFSGPITLRNALTHSVNVVTVKIAQEVGTDYIKSYAQRLGISSPLHNDLSMALGSSSISLYELTKAYSVFADQGNPFKPIFIKRILDRDGNLLEENLPPFYSETSSKEERIIAPQTAFLMTYLMEGVVKQGTGWRARSLGRPVAAKTGTTDQFMDAWFIGYTPELITGVWVGFDEERSLGDNETGARAASPIWVAFMSKMLKDKPVKDFLVPEEGIEFIKIDPKTGQLSLEKDGILECFREGTGPTQRDPSPIKTSTDFFKYDFNFSAKPQ
ncbi:MAG TPA: PBP1A family penicillin-binding protein [Thermodesulfobacteriota bacterium]|nr:PBP1A family penicillin-binding protein [Thermodesulfobacteriota bacterium]